MSGSVDALTRRRVLIVDDHPVVRQGLALAIGREPDLEVCGEAEHIEEALRLVEGGQPGRRHHRPFAWTARTASS